MKKLIVLSVFGAFSVLSTVGQDAKGGPVIVTPQPVQKPKEEKKTPLNPPKTAGEVLGKIVIDSGYFMDFLRAERKRAFFDLSAPLDPAKDMENVFFNSPSELAHPIILFRIKF